jgi:hypothetical protein
MLTFDVDVLEGELTGGDGPATLVIDRFGFGGFRGWRLPPRLRARGVRSRRWCRRRLPTLCRSRSLVSQGCICRRRGGWGCARCCGCRRCGAERVSLLRLPTLPALLLRQRE